MTGAQNGCKAVQVCGVVAEAWGVVDGVVGEGEGGGGRGVVGGVGCSTLHSTVTMSGSSDGCGGLVDGLRQGSGETVGGLWAGRRATRLPGVATVW